jgi:hypothetical protein
MKIGGQVIFQNKNGVENGVKNGVKTIILSKGKTK